MARKLYYKIPDNGVNKMTDEEWSSIARLQHWYNSEFMWTSGKLALKRYAVFSSIHESHLPIDEFRSELARCKQECFEKGFTEQQTLEVLEKEKLIVVKQGGYFDGCLASGFTRVVGNEFNAYLVCEFLLKASLIARHVNIAIFDEGEFIKSREVSISNGSVYINENSYIPIMVLRNLVDHRHVFAIVDSAKYDHAHQFRSIIPGFNDLSKDERTEILHEWNWLGFENNYDMNGDDVHGYNLNEKVMNFEVCT